MDIKKFKKDMKKRNPMEQLGDAIAAQRHEKKVKDANNKALSSRKEYMGNEKQEEKGTMKEGRGGTDKRKEVLNRFKLK